MSASGKPRLLDLFCCEGGAAEGYRRAGFDVYGVDNAPQPLYPFAFHSGDALDVLRRLLAGEAVEFVHCDGRVEALTLSDFAAVHASPPCQAYSDLKSSWNAKEHPELIEPTREALVRSGLPWVIENVEGAPLRNTLRLCGSMFGLGIPGFQLRRHRLFELSEGLFTLQPSCHHSGAVVGVYGDHLRSRGHWRKGADFPGEDKVKLASEALGIHWMTWHGLSQSIPPAYAEFIGHVLMEYVEQVAA